MTNRGRPRTNGVKPLIIFYRNRAAVSAFRAARAAGAKQTVAIDDAIAVVKMKYPDLAISRTEMNRILAALQPRGATELSYLVRHAPSGAGAVPMSLDMILEEKFNEMRANKLAPRKQALPCNVTTCYEQKILQHPRSNVSVRPRRRTPK
jgi:hypothetical protein